MASVDGNNRSRALKQRLHFLGVQAKIVQFVTDVGKFATDSAIFNSLKAAIGGNPVRNIVKEGLDKRTDELKVVMDKMQSKMKEVEGQRKNLKQCHISSAQSHDQSKPLKKLPGEGTQGLDATQSHKKRIFIRSRL